MNDSGLPHVKSWSFRCCTSVPNDENYPSWYLQGCSLIPNRGDGYKFDEIISQTAHDGCFKLGTQWWGITRDRDDNSEPCVPVCCWYPICTPVNYHLPTLLLLGGCCLLDMACLSGWYTVTTIAAKSSACCNWACIGAVASATAFAANIIVDMAVSAATGAGVTAIPCVPIAATMFLYHNCCDMKHSFPIALIKGCASGCFAVGVNGCTYVFHRGAPNQTSPVVPVVPSEAEGSHSRNNDTVISAQPRSSEVRVIRNFASDDKAILTQPKTNNNNLHNTRSDDKSDMQEMGSSIVPLSHAATTRVFGVNELNVGAMDIDKLANNLESAQL